MADEIRELTERIDRLERELKADPGADRGDGASRATGDLVDRVNVLGARVGKLEAAAGLATPPAAARGSRDAKSADDEALFDQGDHSPNRDAKPRK